LSHQIEHHLFPDVPAHRYPEIAREVRTICEKHGVPYNSAPLGEQLKTVVERIVRCAFPPERASVRASKPRVPAERRSWPALRMPA
jgi:fatty acid desaturase